MAENPVINVLRRGQESTDKLKAALVQHNLPSEVKLLLKEITGVFSEAVAMSQNVVASPELPLPGADENGMYTNSKKKRRIQVAPKFSGRKRAVANSCNKVTLQTMDDGFTWRKYGQKEIFSAKYPRSYFRCTHKYDQNCLATRQVQLCEQQPDMYEITYFGEHTCNQAKKLCQEKENPYIIDFNSNTNNTMQHFSSSPPLSSSIKNEQEEEVMSNQTSPGSINTTSPDHQPVIDSDYLGLDLEYINLRDSLSMEFDNGGALEFGNIESMFSCSQFESLFQNIDC